MSYTASGFEVVYVPGDSLRNVTVEDHSSLTPRGYISDHGIRSHRVTIDRPTAWERRGILAVIVCLALGLIVDGATLLFIAWLNQ